MKHRANIAQNDPGYSPQPKLQPHSQSHFRFNINQKYSTPLNTLVGP